MGVIKSFSIPVGGVVSQGIPSGIIEQSEYEVRIRKEDQDNCKNYLQIVFTDRSRAKQLICRIEEDEAKSNSYNFILNANVPLLKKYYINNNLTREEINIYEEINGIITPIDFDTFKNNLNAITNYQAIQFIYSEYQEEDNNFTYLNSINTNINKVDSEISSFKSYFKDIEKGIDRCISYSKNDDKFTITEINTSISLEANLIPVSDGNGGIVWKTWQEIAAL